MRAVALLGPFVKEQEVRRFQVPGVSIFTGNELDPTDDPAAALIFGGDGTIHRHLGVLSVKQIPTLIVPVGSGNDFAQSIGLGSLSASLAAWLRFCTSGDNVRSFDLGSIEPLDRKAAPLMQTAGPWECETLQTLHFVPDGPRLDLPQMGPRIMQSQVQRAAEAKREIATQTLFACIAGTGLDAAVNRRTLTQPRWLRAHGGYVAALLQVLGEFQPPHMTVTAEIKGNWQTVADEPGMLIAAGNGPQYGNGMRLAHEADMQDGLLDICFVRNVSKLRLLRFFHVVFRGGHIGMKEVGYLKAKRVRIATQPTTEVFADGEFICSTPVEIGIELKALRVIA